MAIAAQVNKRTTISTAVNSGSSTISLTSAVFDTFSDDYLVVDYDNPTKLEVIRCSVSGSTVTIIARGQDGTSSQDHDIGAKISWNLVESHINSLPQLPDTSYRNLLKNSNFNNVSTNGYGGTPDDWTNSSANPVQGGFPAMTKQNVIDLLGVTTNDIEGLWNLNGNFNDLSDNGYNLTASGSPTDSSDGLMAQAKDFESSSSQYASNAAANIYGVTGSQTWFGWIKPESIGANMSPFGTNNAGNTLFRGIYIPSTNQVQFALTGLTTNATVTSDVTIEAGKWYFVCGVYDSANSKLKIWVNGIKKEVTASGSATATTASTAVGRSGDYAAVYYDGLLQNVGMLSTALSDDQVKRLWAATTWKGQKIRRSGSDGYIYQSLPQDLVERLRGQAITVAAEMYQDTASIGQISIYDGTETASTASATTASWVTVSATKTISTTATEITIRLKVSTSNGNAWFKELRAHEGSSILPYAASTEDWARFPYLLRLDPPGATNGYSYEENRTYSFTPSWTASGSMTYGTITLRYAKYRLNGKSGFVAVSATGTTGGVASTYITISNSPVIGEYTSVSASYVAGSAMISDGGFTTSTMWTDIGDSSGLRNIYFAKSSFGNWGLGSGREVTGEIIIPTA